MNLSSLATDLASVLGRFRALVSEHVNSGQLLTVDQHIDRLANVAEADVTTADAVAHEVLGELYGALHTIASGQTPAEPAPAAAQPSAQVAQVAQTAAQPSAQSAQVAQSDAQPVAQAVQPVELGTVDESAQADAPAAPVS